ncbi:hst3 protein [Seiridium cupressi]
MPTVQITPSSTELLQNVADTLNKAKKVVVITGAGISTNSGIPDFRSEHGLYSLIQAQFDKAEASGVVEDDDTSVDGDINDRPSKRRRTSRAHDVSFDSSPSSSRSDTSSEASPVIAFPGLKSRKLLSCNNDAPISDLADQQVIQSPTPQADSQRSGQRITRSYTSTGRPALPRHLTEASSESSGSNDSTFSTMEMSRSSTQTDMSVVIITEEKIVCAQHTTRTPTKVVDRGQFSSSPLSSPPPILFDPYDRSDEPTDRSSNCSESEGSDQDDDQTLDFLSSQTSQARLRTMKGRDLFDSNIWADPLKTSVFYRFATTLRQKVKEVEPTTTHHFIARLRDIGKLTRVYTQNIDEIEKKIGLSTDLKVGAGNKRRKSAKQQRTAEGEKPGNEEPSQPKEEDDSSGKDASQSSQNPEIDDSNKHRTTTPPDKGVECVFLHGSLQALRCFVCARLCDWDAEDRETLTMSGEQPECPHCAGATAARQEKGKRALGVGKLRPDIVLYGEEHPQSDLISPIVQHDLSTGPDLLLVLGTSLKVHGLKVMVREFARAIHQKGGKVVFINFTKPSESTWGDVIDYWVQWDCDAWVDDLKERKPTLWMSPDAIVEYEKLKREELAEKKREAACAKKRESMGERRRENSGIIKKRAAVQALENKPRPKQTPVPVPIPFGFSAPEPAPQPAPEPVIEPVIEPVLKPAIELVMEPIAEPPAEPPTRQIPELVSKPVSEPVSDLRSEPNPDPEQVPSTIKEPEQSATSKTEEPEQNATPTTQDAEQIAVVKIKEAEQKASPKAKEPAKNPQAERNDYNCGAYCMSKIAEAFYLIRGEKFDFFGYTPSTKQSARTVPKTVPSRRPAVKEKKPRLSSLAILPTLREPVMKNERHRRPTLKASLLLDSKTDRSKKAASELISARRPETPQRGSLLRGHDLDDHVEGMFSDFQLRIPGNHDSAVTGSSSDSSSMPESMMETYRPSASVSAAVKSNPRKRKPTAKAKGNAPTTPVAVTEARSSPGVSQMQVVEQENVLPPFRIAEEQLAGPRLATMEPSLNPSPPHSPLDQTPLASLSPNQRKFSLQHLQHPMMLSSPLIKLPFGIRKESTPSPSDQLREEAAIALSGMRMCL